MIDENGDEWCRCGKNKHIGQKRQTALEMEQDLADKMANEILKEIDDIVIAEIHRQFPGTDDKTAEAIRKTLEEVGRAGVEHDKAKRRRLKGY